MNCCFRKFKVSRFIYHESRVTQELQVATFLKNIWTEGINAEENEEFSRNDELIHDVSDNISNLRDDLRVNFLKTLETENPALFALYKQISEKVRGRVKEVLKGFTNITEIDLPEGFVLRPKQEALLPKIQEYFADGTKRTGFIKHPPGMGKTHMMGLMIRSLAKHSKVRCLVLSPRDTINKQNERKIQKMQEEGVKVKDIFDIKSGEEPDVTIGTYQHAALEAEKEPEDSAFGDYDVIFLDECHRGFGPKLLQLLRTRYPDKIIIGLSATPYLGATSDPKKLRSAFQYFEGQIDDISLKDACNDGDLVPIRAMQVKVKTEQFDEKDNTEAQMEKKINKDSRTNIAVNIAQKEISVGEKGIVFCSGVDHAEATALAMQKAGLKAAHVDYTMSSGQREEILEAYRAGELQFIVNADLLIEGFDDTAIKHVIVLRPTPSLWIYEQMIGRGGRIDENDPKKILTVWDVVGQHSKQCTIQGLHEMYIGHKNAYENGDVLFGADRVCGGESLQNRSDGERQLGVDGVMEGIIKVEDVGRIVIPRDRAYYENPKNVRADLEAFAKMAGLKSPLELTPKHALVRAICSNGETIGWNSYWSLAGVRLGFAETTSDAPTLNAGVWKIMQKLFETAGFESQEYIRRDRKYYEDKEKVKKDLAAFAKAAGLDSPLKLTTYFNRDKAVCTNGDEIEWQAYWRGWTIQMGIVGEDPSKQGSANVAKLLAYTFELKEKTPRNKEYYSNIEYIKKDLQAYASAAGVSDPAKLKTSHNPIRVKCSNGEEDVSWGTHWKTAAVYFGFTESSQKTTGVFSKTLNKLLSIAGYEVKEFAPRDKAYYENRMNVRADLIAFAAAAGIANPADISTSPRVSVVCANGEMVYWESYYKNAAVKLGIARICNEAGAKSSEAVKLLVKKARF